MNTHTSGAADLPEAPTTFCWATELAMAQEPVTLSAKEAREISAEMQRLHSLAAGQAVAPAEAARPYPPLPEVMTRKGHGSLIPRWQAIEQMEAYVDADRATRPAPPAMDGGEDARWLAERENVQHSFWILLGEAESQADNNDDRLLKYQVEGFYRQWNALRGSSIVPRWVERAARAAQKEVE